MEEREISIKELIDVIWKGKFMILILAVAFFLVGIVGSVIMENRSSEVSTVLSLQWQGVIEGEYPDGTRFDYNTAIEAYVITLALEAQGIETLTTNDVRGAMNIVPIVPNNMAIAIQNALEDGEQIAFYPTDYKIIINNNALDLTVDETSDLIIEIIDQFRIDFEKRYIQTSVILDFTNEDFDDYDYVDIHNIFETQISIIESAMNDRVELDPGYISPTLGIGFSNILVRTDLVNQLELSQISSRTNTYLLTKDVEYLITNYTFKIDQKQLELDKALVNVVDAQTMIDNYTGSVNTIIIPGLETDFEVDTYYNVLIDNLVLLQREISELENDIIYIETQIVRLNGEDPNYIISDEKTEEEIEKVEEFILSAKGKLSDIVSDSNIMLSEYYTYTTSDVIKPLMSPQYESSVSKLMYAGIGLIIGAGIGTVVVLFKHDWE